MVEIAIRPSLRSIYRREVDRGFARVARAGDGGVVTEADLARHHPLVQRYLRRTGVVGKPRVHAMRAHFAADLHVYGGAHAAFEVRLASFRRIVDARRVRGIFTNAAQTVSAELAFDDAGDLASWVSEDRSMTTDGKSYESYPWVTPLYEYRDYHGYRIPSGGDAIWQRPQGDFAYGRFRLLDVAFDSFPDERAVVRDDLLRARVASVISDPRVA